MNITLLHSVQVNDDSMSTSSILSVFFLWQLCAQPSNVSDAGMSEFRCHDADTCRRGGNATVRPPTSLKGLDLREGTGKVWQTEMQSGGQFYNISHVFYLSAGRPFTFPTTEGSLSGHTEP